MSQTKEVKPTTENAENTTLTKRSPEKAKAGTPVDAGKGSAKKDQGNNQNEEDDDADLGAPTKKRKLDDEGQAKTIATTTETKVEAKPSKGKVTSQEADDSDEYNDEGDNDGEEGEDDKSDSFDSDFDENEKESLGNDDEFDFEAYKKWKEENPGAGSPPAAGGADDESDGYGEEK